MHPVRFAVLPALVAGFLAATPQPSNALADLFAAIDGQGADPLADAYPFFVEPTQRETARILFQSDSFRGRVTLTVNCCKDTSGNSVTPPTGVTFEALPDAVPPPPPPKSSHTRFYQLRAEFPLSATNKLGPNTPTPAPPAPPDLMANEFMTGGHHARWLGLKVTADGSPQVGRYVVEFVATGSDNTRVSTFVIVNILPWLTDSPMAHCAAYSTAPGTSAVVSGLSPTATGLLDSDNLMAVAQQLFDQKRKAPNQTVWPIAYATGAAQTAGAQLTLSKRNLLPTQALFFFTNASAFTEEVVMFDGRNCTPAATITVPGGGTALPFLGDASSMTTLLFRRNDGKSGWENLSYLNEGVFWTVFGGKEVDIDIVKPAP